ncbi:putative enoyl-CoA hydratase/isomerase YngF [Trichinella pseudospiralis]|uniref:Putative enoyl-CoA hydratase/isomerase YngF n=1 Tax=Trichinella pseudospiralis TaxID=6337 RepID=A0A0V1E5Y0_TRIPS|nr:putative enoyl-CoA hydratase/isomerase YngF [Trichinella pseudospiralis]KRX90097.1 putative enoyl-CoA hydratase/isomerase YngF [Trichinella pseudospiralis]KRY69148.1 putative enoyl-CoA hydratase/isomerase YngF [Trichinella pseudospiralis]KRZ27119.1 putative enoyl-CoA hydratase/isomerase YngF [Trichinella pseudospiralis]KRZ38746.1 putative enoyl-CoA hydratase/isomerase YngF [Trichinella pseudospiralis]
MNVPFKLMKIFPSAKTVSLKKPLHLHVNNKIIPTRTNSTGNEASEKFHDAEKKDPVIVENIDRIALIGINRPERRNAIDKRTAKLLIELFNDFEKNSTLDVAVLYGKGGNFCSGFDMKELAKSRDEINTLIEECTRYKMRPLGPTLKQFEKPVIAAVNGYAVAGGLELALMCDLRIVEETAILGMYNRRFDIPMTDGGSVRLPKMIGLSRALDLIITGRQINGRTAFDWGLANRLVDTGTALGQAMNLARIIGTLPKTSLLSDRNSAYYSTFESCNFEDAMQFELRNANNAICNGTCLKGIKKFVVDGQGRHGSFKVN